MNPFWSLPGPGAFVQAAAEDVRQGRSVAFCLPEWHPPGFYQACRSVLPPEDGWNWELLEPGSEVPLDFRFARFAPEYPAQLRRTVWALDEQTEFRGFVFWLEGLEARSWTAISPRTLTPMSSAP